MPKTVYVSKRFSASNEALIATAERICDEYARQGYDLTLRQLYYQFVSRDIIPNTLQSYKHLGSVVNDARLAGLIDWHHLVDRGRNLAGRQHWTDPAQIVRAIGVSYLTDRWADQETRLEVWVEKDALSGVIAGPCRRADVDYFACKGYVSQSEMWSAAQRLLRYEDAGQETVIVHMGDHDPSGIDMTRDIGSRLEMFGARTEVIRVALNMDQVDQYGPPPNPAKITDSRAGAYIDRFGRESWELDALDPAVLGAIVDDYVSRYRDMELWDAATERMEAERTHLSAVSDHWPQVERYLDTLIAGEDI
jgi:hypothetical protein